MALGVWDEEASYSCLDKEAIEDSGHGLEVETSHLVTVLCQHCGPHQKEDEPELKFRESLDVFSASEKIRSLAARLEDGLLDNAEDADVLRLEASGRGQSGSDVHEEVQLSDVEEGSRSISDSIGSNCDEDSDSRMEELESVTEDDYELASWDVSDDDLKVVKGLFKKVPGSRAVVGQLLAFRMQSLASTVQRIQRLHVMNVRKKRRERKAEIENALEKAAIPKWPDSEAVDRFIKVSEVS